MLDHHIFYIRIVYFSFRGIFIGRAGRRDLYISKLNLFTPTKREMAALALQNSSA